jgi:hypothetical protein
VVTATPINRGHVARLGQVTEFYGMERYAEDVKRALRGEAGTAEIAVTDSEAMCFEVRALHRALNLEGIGVINFDQTYAFFASALEEDRTYHAIERLGQLVAEREATEPWRKWVPNGYRDVGDAVAGARRGEPEAIGKLCRFLSAVYTDPEYDSPLLGGIRKSIEDVSVRVEFSKQMEA